MRNSSENFHKKLLGRVGEKTAVKFLKNKGYKILDLNYKNNVGEIDIVAKDGEAIVFAEVKTRSSEAFGTPAQAVDYYKREKYKKIAALYLVEKFKTTYVLSRFDVIEIEDSKINHIINAFCC